MNLSKDPKSVIVSFLNLDDTIVMSQVNREWKQRLMYGPLLHVVHIARQTIGNLTVMALRNWTLIGWRELLRNEDDVLQSIMPEKISFWAYQADKSRRPRLRRKVRVDTCIPRFDHFRLTWGMLWKTKVEPYLHVLNQERCMLLMNWYQLLKSTACGYVTHYAVAQTMYMLTDNCQICGFMIPTHYFETDGGPCAFCVASSGAGDNNQAITNPKMTMVAATRNLGALQNGMELD